MKWIQRGATAGGFKVPQQGVRRLLANKQGFAGAGTKIFLTWRWELDLRRIMEEAVSDNADKKAILHKIRNCLSPLQTFLEAVDTSKGDPRLHQFHQTCKESFSEVKELLKQLEEV